MQGNARVVQYNGLREWPSPQQATSKRESKGKESWSFLAAGGGFIVREKAQWCKEKGTNLFM